jgi:hypothetical protein
VREGDCPFCGAKVSVGLEPRRQGRRSRFAIIYGAAAIATATATGCSEPVYGAPIPDASTDAGFDAPATFYGAVPPDGGKD